MIIQSLHNENELLRKVAKGDEQAFRLLFDHHKDSIYTFSLKILQSEPMAEEIVQESFVKVWTARSSLPEVNDFSSWLYILARNLSFNQLKKLAREKRLSGELLLRQEEASFTEDIILHKEYQGLLARAIANLPPQQKLVYNLSRDKGLKREEIAAALNLAPETVKAHLALAMKFIRTYIKNYDSSLPFIILPNLLIFFKVH